MSTEYDAAMLARLRASKTEAAREVLAFYEKDHMSMYEAVNLVVEMLPRKKTAQIVRWAQNWKAFLEWMELQAKGWKIADVTRVRVFVNAPVTVKADIPARYYISNEDGQAMADAVAAGADVGETKFLNSEYFTKYRPAATAIYEVTRHL